MIMMQIVSQAQQSYEEMKGHSSQAQKVQP